MKLTLTQRLHELHCILTHHIWSDHAICLLSTPTTSIETHYIICRRCEMIQPHSVHTQPIPPATPRTPP